MERRKGLPIYDGSIKLYILLSFLIMIEACAIISQAYFLARALSLAFDGKALSEFQLDIWLFFASLAIRMLIQYVQTTLSENFAKKTSESLRNKLIASFLNANLNKTNQYGTARLTTLAVDGIRHFKTYLEMIGPRMIRSFVVPFFIFLYTFSLDKMSGIILALAVPIIIAFMILLGVAAQKVADKQYDTYQKLANHFIDSLKGLVTLKFLGKSKQHAENIEKSSKNYRNATMRTLRIAFLSSFALNFFTSLAIAFVAIGLGYRLIDGIIVLQPALTILILAPEYFMPIQQVGADYHATLDGQVAENEINTFIEKAKTKDKQNQKEFSEVQSIAFSNVHLAIDDQNILKNINFSLPHRGNIALVGASGAGKTTILHLLAGQIDKTSGQIYINEREQSLFHNDEWLKQIAFIPQTPYIFPMSVKDNLRFYNNQATEKQMIDVLEKINMLNIVQSFPNGLDERIGEDGRSLSGGQEQRIALARALLSDKKIILLDEPTAHLDIETEYEIKQFILKEFSNRLVILSTHRLHWVENMDLVFNIQNGKIIDTFSQPTSETKKQIYKNYSQKRGESSNA